MKAIKLYEITQACKYNSDLFPVLLEVQNMVDKITKHNENLIEIITGAKADQYNFHDGINYGSEMQPGN